jgi:hypothetical protein
MRDRGVRVFWMSPQAGSVPVERRKWIANRWQPGMPSGFDCVPSGLPLSTACDNSTLFESTSDTTDWTRSLGVRVEWGMSNHASDDS